MRYFMGVMPKRHTAHIDELLTFHELQPASKMKTVVAMMTQSYLLVKDLWAEREADNAELRKALWKGQGATS